MLLAAEILDGCARSAPMRAAAILDELHEWRHIALFLLYWPLLVPLTLLHLVAEDCLRMSCPNPSPICGGPSGFRKTVYSLKQ